METEEVWLCLRGEKLFKKRLCLAGQTIAPDMTVCRGTVSHLEPNAFGSGFFWLRAADMEAFYSQTSSYIWILESESPPPPIFYRPLKQQVTFRFWVCDVSQRLEGPCSSRKHLDAVVHLSAPLAMFYSSLVPFSGEYVSLCKRNSVKLTRGGGKGLFKLSTC